MSEATFVATDNAPSIEGSLTNDDGTAFDLTDATSVRFQMTLEGAGVFTVNAVAVIVGDPTEGNVRYDWADDDLDTPGTYRARWRILFSDGARQHTIPADSVVVEPQ